MNVTVVEGNLLDQKTEAIVIGAGSGGFDPAAAEGLMLETLESLKSPLDVLLVRYRKVK